MGSSPIAEHALPEGSLIIADLHLDPAGDERVEGFCTWLRSLSGIPALLVLGDLFDVWVGPVQARLAGSGSVVRELAAFTSRGGWLGIVPGNRDFLLDASFEHATGAELFPGGLTGRLGSDAGPRALLLHGDELCTLDLAYQRMKRVLRSGPLTWVAKRLPLPVARFAAGRLRRVSQRAVPQKPIAEKSMQESACFSFASEANVDTLICGHAHLFRDERIPGGPRWIVLDAYGGARDCLRVGPDGDLRALQSTGAAR